MTDARWSRIGDLFERAADLPPEAQLAFVADECGDDSDLAAAVLSLLAHDRAQGASVASAIDAAARLLPVVTPSDPSTKTAPIVTRCGPYRVVRELGRGGMGIVFEAVRDDGAYTKRVALKVATRAAYSPEFVHRFQGERQILARLEHPHIARFLDGGAAEDGTPYFAMELVDGTPIHQYVERHRLGLTERLRLFLQVCDAVDYAHQNLVIHRDLTPRNILVADGSVRLLDFGISKLLDASDGGLTATGHAPFTPAYGSPEQLRGDAITTRTDVYALGLVLFELLTGARAQDVDGTSPVALARVICETPIPAPSATAQVRADKATARRLRGDLDTIVAAATEKDPARRYASVAALADDVRRHLEAEPVRARRASAWYRTSRFTRRHWRALTAAALVIVTVLGGVITTRRQARRAERRFDEVRRLVNVLIDDLHTAIRDLPGSTAAQELVVATAVRYLEALVRESGNDRALLAEIGQGYTKVAELAFSRSRPSLGRPDEARRYLERAEGVLAPLYAADPDDVGIAVAMIRMHTARGGFLNHTGERVTGLQSLEQAIQIGETTLARHPRDRAALTSVIDAYGNVLGSFETSPSALRHAPAYLRRAEQLAASAPGDDRSRARLAVAYAEAGKVAAAAERVDDALRHFQRAADIQAERIAAEPFNATARRNLMLAWSNLADMALGPLGLSSYSGPGGPPVSNEGHHRRQALDAAMRAIAEAEWLHRHHPDDPAAMFDYAIATGRSAPAYPPGDAAAIAALERALAQIGALEPTYPDRVRQFQIEFYGSLAERHRQTGQLGRARMAWRDADATFRKAIAAAPDAYYPRRQFIPIVQNWAETLSTRGDAASARRLAERAIGLADDVGIRGSQYARAPGWPPRVRMWAAGFYASLGDDLAARRSSSEGLTRWREVAARTDLPADLLAEANAALARNR